MYQLSKRSLNNLTGVHPELVACVVLALKKYSEIDFGVIEGVRTLERQKVLVDNGSSWTMNSRHLIQSDGFGHAVDLAPWVGGTIPWEDWGAFEVVSKAMMLASSELGIAMTWGGDWKVKDGPHFELKEG